MGRLLSKNINNKTNNKMKKTITQGVLMFAMIIGGLALAIWGYAQSESYKVAQIQPLSKAIHIANMWLGFVAFPGAVICIAGFVWLASKSGSK